MHGTKKHLGVVTFHDRPFRVSLATRASSERLVSSWRQYSRNGVLRKIVIVPWPFELVHTHGHRNSDLLFNDPHLKNEMMPLDDSTRCLCRTWHRNKSDLQKYSSLPELQLAAKEKHCRQCGSTNSPSSLMCTWTCKEAKHEFKGSIPRVRRASVPPRVFMRIDLSPSSRKIPLLGDNPRDSNRSTVPSHQTETNVTLSVINTPIVPSISLYMPVHHTSVDATHVYDTDANVDTLELHPIPAIPEGFDDVATATRSTRTVAVEPMGCNSEKNNNAKAETESSTMPHASRILSGQILSGSRLENVDSLHSNSTTTMKPNRALKVSRRVFNLSDADKMPHLDDAHEHPKNASLNHDDMTPPPIIAALSPKHQHFRPLRRKNHLQIMPSRLDSDASEPIAISLTLHPQSTPSHLSKKSSQKLRDYVSPLLHTRAHSDPQSIFTSVSSNSTDAITPPMTPTHQRSPPNSEPPKMKSASGTGGSSSELSSIRLGHPSRPYYNAIRKNGISPSPRSRPQSQPPPSSFHLGFDLTPAVTTAEPTKSSAITSTPRHSSMSGMLASPPALSALVLSDDDDNDDNGDFELHSGPTNPARISMTSSLHRLSLNSHTQTLAHHSQSLSRAKGISHRSSGVGFSMSGETELRMALATSSPPSGIATVGRTTEDGFRFRETAIPSKSVENNDNIVDSTADYLHTRNRSRDGFIGRVKKLRKGLKEMLMNKNTTTATIATT